MSTPATLARLPLPLALASMLVLVTSGCAAVRVTSHADDAPALRAARGYAWATETLDALPADVDARLVAAVDAALAARGLPRTEADAADLLLTRAVDLEVETRWSDPYYWSAYADRYEMAVLTLTLSDPTTGAPAWSGRARATLRKLAQTVGTDFVRFVDVERARAWPIEEMVEALLAELPLGPVGAPGAR